MPVKPWPEKGTVYVEELLDPLRAVLQQAIDKGDDVYETGLDYNGYDYRAPGCMDPTTRFQAWYLKEIKVNQGIDVFDQILVVAFQMGFQQAERSLAEDR